MLYTVLYFISLISTLADCTVLNKGISNPLCSKNGFICSINGFIVALIISSTFSNILSVELSFNNIGLSKSTNGYTVITPLSSNSQAI